MREHGQATVEYVGIAVAIAVLLAAVATIVPPAVRSSEPAGRDRDYLTLARSHIPQLVLERGDATVPVDFRRCRSRACAAGSATLFVHAVRLRGFLYLEYWAYLPDSRTAGTGIDRIDGAHADDWEGVIVKLTADGAVIGARVSAHLGWAGRHPWWSLAENDWAPYPAPVYRAAGSHAGSFGRSGIDLAGDSWDGDGRRVVAGLVAADEAGRTGAVFAEGSIPPWEKTVWQNPEAVITGRPGDRAAYARYARWWAWVCLPCRLR
jgi:hypothetical protein